MSGHSPMLPPGFVFYGIQFEPYVTLFIRRHAGETSEILQVPFEIALEQPVELLAPGKDAAGQRARLEHIRWHQHSRDAEALA